MAYGDRPVFSDLSCSFPRGKISVILGGSGCGKSSILRLIGGLARPRSGRILVEGVDITGLDRRQLYAVRGKLGMLFQGGALLDSMTVFDNVALPLRESGETDEKKVQDSVTRYLNAVGLHDIDDLLPGQLSGGMLKRVALARALVGDPPILLADEPFSGLDPVSTKLVEALLVKLNHSLGISMLVVSHHVPSTLRMADHVLLMLPDGVVQGHPGTLLGSSDERVRGFLDEDADDAPEDAVERLGRIEAEATMPR